MAISGYILSGLQIEIGVLPTNPTKDWPFVFSLSIEQTMGHSNVWNSHPKNYGPGSRTCCGCSIVEAAACFLWCHCCCYRCMDPIRMVWTIILINLFRCVADFDHSIISLCQLCCL